MKARAEENIMVQHLAAEGICITGRIRKAVRSGLREIDRQRRAKNIVREETDITKDQ